MALSRYRLRTTNIVRLGGRHPRIDGESMSTFRRERALSRKEREVEVQPCSLLHPPHCRVGYPTVELELEITDHD